MKDSLKIYQHQYLNYLLLGDHKKCSELISIFISENFDIKQLYEGVIKESLYQVGTLWEKNLISVATEHLASSIVEANLNELYPLIISKEKKEKTAIVSCLENEYHQIGLKMVSDIFEMHGWKVHFLGANTPTNELFNFLCTIKPNLLGISLSIYFHLPTLEKILGRAETEFPDVTVLVGGQAFNHGGEEVLVKFKNAIMKKNVHELDDYLKIA